MSTPLAFGIHLPADVLGVTRPSDREAVFAKARRLAALADIVGLDYILGAGGTGNFPTEVTLALLGAARRARVVAPVSVTAWHPGLLARFGLVAARVSGGRFGIDLRGGPHPEDRRVDEFVDALQTLWAGSLGGEERPEIVVSSGWRAGVSLAARTADRYVSPALPLEDMPARMVDLATQAAAVGRSPGFAMSASVLVRAPAGHRWVTPNSDSPLDRIDEAERRDAQTRLTGLRGRPDVIAARLDAYRRVGVGLFVLDLPDPEVDLPVFAREVIPLVRELERQSAPIAAV
jgi:FMNH2-dependent dimethyl sulfone monooxygenase